MLTALLFGLVASSALVIGTVVGAYWRPPRFLLAAALAFASGSLITALAFDLFEEAFNTGGAWPSALGLVAGAAAFVVANTLLDRRIARSRRRGFGVCFASRRDTRGYPGEYGPRRFPARGCLGAGGCHRSSGRHLRLQPARGLRRGGDMRSQVRSRTFVIGAWAATGVLLAPPWLSATLCCRARAKSYCL